MDREATFAMPAFAAPVLARLVGAPWAMAYGAPAAAMPGIVAPDAHVEFVFQTGAPCATLAGPDEAPRPSPRAMLYAQRHGTLRLVPTGANALLAFRAAPAVAAAILGRPLAGCWDRPVPLAELIGAEADRLVERMTGLAPSAQAALVERWLLARLGDWGAEHERNLRLQRLLLWRAGAGPVSTLADALGVTARTLRRHFERHAGLSPKQLAMSGRILRACARLCDRPDMAISQIGLSLGFADQAAFTNAFRHYVGTTPGRLRAEPVVWCERPPG